MTDAITSPTCSPTRAAFLTDPGPADRRLAHDHGPFDDPENETVIAEMFRRAGYATRYSASGTLEITTVPTRKIAVSRKSCGTEAGDDRFFQTTKMAYLTAATGTTRNLKPSGFCTDVWFDYAKQFILSSKADKPF